MDEQNTPAVEVSDEWIDEVQEAAYRDLCKTGFSGGMGGLTWDRASARAVIAASRALRASPAVGDVDMPVVATISINNEDDSYLVRNPSDQTCEGFFELVKQADAQAALAAKDAVIAEMWTKEQVQRLTAATLVACEITHGQEIAALQKQVNAYVSLTKSQDIRAATARALRADWQEAIGTLASERLSNSLLTNQIDTLTAERDARRKDAEMLDWLDQNIFSLENLQFDGKLHPELNMWVMFSPKGHQGSARNIIDAAMTHPSLPARSAGR